MFKFVLENKNDEFIGFSVGQNDYCINIQNVEEIIMVPTISKLPNVATHIEGAINLRGKIVQIVNLHKWFELEWQPLTRRSRIIILDVDGSRFGILVDSVHQVFRITERELHDIPAIVNNKLIIPYLLSVITWNDEIHLEINPEALYNNLN